METIEKVQAAMAARFNGAANRACCPVFRPVPLKSYPHL